MICHSILFTVNHGKKKIMTVFAAVMFGEEQEEYVKRFAFQSYPISSNLLGLPLLPCSYSTPISPPSSISISSLILGLSFSYHGFNCSITAITQLQKEDNYGEEDESESVEVDDYVEEDEVVKEHEHCERRRRMITIDVDTDIYTFAFDKMTLDVIRRIDFKDVKVTYRFYNEYKSSKLIML
ncbi:hypothetical protein RIF29_28400 [Crotalaria pallida]|uniref:Uncharacterized protein n=1 Tax=Crotalaria pallida TaxID=3830 RepID=A0AAN9EEY7_CROPI